MFSLSKEQKLANLKETLAAKQQKYLLLGNEIVLIKRKIAKLTETSTTESKAPSAPDSSISAATFPKTTKFVQ